MRRHGWIACLLALAIEPPMAFADDDAPPPEDAQSLVRRGVELRRAHKNQEALDTFKRAQALAPSARTRAQLALAEQALGQWVDAADDLDAVLADVNDAWIAKNRDVLQDARTTVEGHLAFLTVDVASVPSARVDFDGVALIPGGEMRVVAAPGTLVTRADQFAPDVQRITLAPGEHRHVAVSLVPLNARPVANEVSPARVELAPIPQPAPAHGRAVAGPVTLAAVGLAGIVTGTIFGLRTIHEKNERDAECVGGCTAAGTAFDSKARNDATISTVAFGAGAAFLIGGGAWWLFSGRSGPTVSARVAPGGFGLTLGGSF